MSADQAVTLLVSQRYKVARLGTDGQNLRWLTIKGSAHGYPQICFDGERHSACVVHRTRTQ